uniref:Lipocalin n=1 Tax=Rhipicephalus zambeziensis TaxID=60191 RepID=A0A224YC41_9ACAR
MQPCQFAILLLAVFTFAHALDLEDLRKALDTDETIWLKKRSYPRDNTCVRASRDFLNGADYKFQQYFKSGDEEKTNTLFGKLHQEAGQNPYMIVSKSQGENGIKYTLESWNSEEKCGVLTLQLPGQSQKQCEMHVWNSNVNGDLKDCEEKYQMSCPGRQYEVDC